MTRNSTIDLARIMASFGVITIHVHNSTPAAKIIGDLFWPLCVPFFYSVSLAYFAGSIPNLSARKVVMRAWKRLAIPYLVWTTIYTGLLITKHLLVGQHTPLIWWRILFYGESAVHLYFLPALLLQQALALSCFLLLSSKWRSGMGFILLSGSIIYLVWGIIHQLITIGQLLSIVIYISIAFWLAPQLAIFRRRWVLASVGILLVVLAVANNIAGHHYSMVDYPLPLLLGGIGLLLTTIALPHQIMSPTFNLLISLSFGIYLSHVLFLEAFELVTERLWPPTGLNYTAGTKSLVSALIFLTASLFTWIVRHFAIGRQLLLGEQS